MMTQFGRGRLAHSCLTMLRVGLNPYGLAYTLGLQAGSEPAPQASGLEGFLAFAAEMRAQVVEIDRRWLVPLTNAELAGLRARFERDDQRVILSSWLSHEAGETLDTALRIAGAIGATLVRLHLTPVLEGGRGRLGAKWHELAEHARRVLIAEAPKAAHAGLALGIENHQDFGSEDLLAMADAAGPNVGLVLDTGNPFAVGEDPIAFARRVAGRVRHVHLKDYRAQFTDDGYRLVRCALGDGCVPLSEMLDIVERPGAELTASVELAALTARHIKLFTPEWWQGYGPRDAAELGVALERLQQRRWPDGADARTPWERGAPPDEIVAYEREQFDRAIGLSAVAVARAARRRKRS